MKFLCTTLFSLTAAISLSACDHNHSHHDNEHSHETTTSHEHQESQESLSTPAIKSKATTLDVQINNAWVRLAPETSDGVNTAAYLTIQNPSDEGLTLESVSSTSAQHTMVHDTVRDDKGLLRMQHLDSLIIPANSAVELKPQGKHIMLMGVTQKLTHGTLFPLTLQFEGKPAMTIKAFVKNVQAKAHSHEHDAHSHHHAEQHSEPAH